MSVMYRIICRKLLVLIRLAIIASLAGYSLSSAVAAVHSAPSADNQASLSQTMDQPTIENALHHDHEDESTGNDGSRLVKQECCSDVCAGFTLVTFQDSPIDPVVSAIREFVDEDFIFGAFPGLHRPPRI